MEQLAAQCNEAATFPENVVTKANEWKIKVHIDFLNKNEPKLFQREVKAALDFLDFQDHARSQAFWSTSAQNLSDVRKICRITRTPTRKDPQCRHIFVHARNARDRLRTTRPMLMLVFTYHKIMPEFLDFLPAFGSQEHARDFNFSAFHQHKHIRDLDRLAAVPELGYSGRGFRLCYNIKAVEPSPSQESWPWSARQSAIHHSFDAESGRATWVTIKGDESMKERIKAATDPKHGNKELSSFATLEQAFVCTLATHELMIRWSTESMRPYIGFLENRAQILTRHTISEEVVNTRLSTLNDHQASRGDQSSDWFKQRFQMNMRRFTGLTTSTTTVPQAPQTPSVAENEKHDLDPEDDLQEDSEEEFSFSRLQDIQNLEEKANECILILTNNASILADIREFYQSIQGIEGWPAKLRKHCKPDIVKFKDSIKSVLSAYSRHQVRLAALLRLVDDRKKLYYGILENRNMEASTLLAKEAHISAGNMEAMTQGMTAIARKTNQETIYMRIITFVTLVFLPGTFISVGRSTLMSTPAVHFDTSNPSSYQDFVQTGPLKIYVALSLPLVAITLLAYWIFYWWEKRKEAKEEEKIIGRKDGDGPDKV